MSIFNKFKLESEKFKIRGYTTKNPDGEWIQELLGEIKRSGLKSINISPCERGAAGELYVYANGHIIGSILKKDQARVEELLKISKKIELLITTTDSGAGYTDYYKANLVFRYKI